MAYWAPLSAVLVALDGLLMLLALIWTVARIIAVTRRQQWSKHRMADMVIILNGIAILMQLVVDVVPSPSVTLVWPGDLASSLVTGILTILNMAMWMAASALVLGFWLDVLRHKMKVPPRSCLN